MQYIVFLESQDGKVTTLSESLNDAITQPRLARELLLILSPYAHHVGGGRWIGAEVSLEPLPADIGLSANGSDDSLLLSHLSISQEHQKNFESRFGTSWAICNFTKGEYITESKPFHSWLSGDTYIGQQLLALLACSDKLLCWSDCQLAVTPTVFPWMTDITEISKQLMNGRISD